MKLWNTGKCTTITEATVIDKEIEQEQRVVLVGIHSKRSHGCDFEGYMMELAALVEARGGVVAATLVQARERPDQRTYLGKGKISELLRLLEESDADLVVFDRELSPGQLQALEELLPVRIIDRTMLILEIFTTRAHSLEGKLQVELASLEYRLPRLAGQGQVLSRTGAGIGTRGLGEQKLELDRRYLKRRINDLKRQLAKVDKTRELHRKQRLRRGVKTISLVGYTNAGKSSIFNALCQKAHSSGKNQAEADQRLFQTLDTTTRKIKLPGGHEVLISDTVGFVQNLPPHLIAAFRSTLEEAVAADIILHIIDISNEAYFDKVEVVNQVLTELGARPEQVHMVFNKIDQAADHEWQQGAVPRISARTGQGVEELLLFIEQALWPKDGSLN
jgi:GTP-binding protein HflX